MSQSTSDGGSVLGMTVDGKYRVERLLGQGGFGAVYRATHVMMNHPCALKVLHGRFISDALAVTRFQREAMAAARIHHPNAIAVTDFGITPEKLVYLVMEFFDGTTLRDLIRREGPLSLERTAHILERAAAALQAAHKQGIIHRDIKPDNIMVRRNDEGEEEVKVLDFGIAKMLDTPADGERLTLTGTVVGTPQYLSPEQCKGGELDARSDIYALGIVTYEMLSGSVPFDGATPFTVAMKHIGERAQPLGELVAGLAPEIDVVVQRAIAKEPADRYQTMSEFARELIATARMAASRAVTGPGDAGTIFVGAPRQPYQKTNGWTPVVGPAGYPPPIPSLPAETRQQAQVPLTLPHSAVEPTRLFGGMTGQDAVAAPAMRSIVATEALAARPSRTLKLVLAAVAGAVLLCALAALAAFIAIRGGERAAPAPPTAAAPAVAPAPAPAPAPAAVPAVPILDCWLGLAATEDRERRVGALGGVVAVAPGEQRIRFHFTPRRKGYLYVVATLENATWAQVTANPARQKLETNAIDVGRDVLVPGRSDTFIPYVGPVTFTIIYSPTQLASPAFFSGPSGRQLSEDEVADWERFRTSASVGRLENASDQGALTMLRGPDPSSEPKALAFTVTLERR